MMRSLRYMLMRAAYDAGKSYIRSQAKQAKARAAGQHWEQWRSQVGQHWPAKAGTAAHLENLLSTPEVADILNRLLQSQYSKGKDPAEAAAYTWAKLWN